MERLNLDPTINIGGHPVTVNDFFTLQRAIDQTNDALANLLYRNNTNKPLVVSGCQNWSNGSNYRIDAGTIFYNAKMWTVPETPNTPTPVGHTVYLEFVETPTFPAAIYQSGQVFQVHTNTLARPATLPSSATPPANFVELNDTMIDFDTVYTFYQSFYYVTARLNTVEDTLNNTNSTAYELGKHWVKVTGAALDALVNIAIAPGSFLAYKIIGKSLAINASIVMAAAANTFLITLPAGLNITLQNAMILAYDDQNLHNAICTVSGTTMNTNSNGYTQLRVRRAYPTGIIAAATISFNITIEIL